MINCTWYPVREILPLHRKRCVNSWWHLMGDLYGLGHENLFFIRVTEYFLLIFNPEEACMVCFLLQNPLNPMNYLFKSIWQNHVGQRIGKQNLRAFTSSTLIHSTIWINKKNLPVRWIKFILPSHDLCKQICIAFIIERRISTESLR